MINEKWALFYKEKSHNKKRSLIAYFSDNEIMNYIILKYLELLEKILVFEGYYSLHKTGLLIRE